MQFAATQRPVCFGRDVKVEMYGQGCRSEGKG